MGRRWRYLLCILKLSYSEAQGMKFICIMYRQGIILNCEISFKLKYIYFETQTHLRSHDAYSIPKGEWVFTALCFRSEAAKPWTWAQMWPSASLHPYLFLQMTLEAPLSYTDISPAVTWNHEYGERNPSPEEREILLPLPPKGHPNPSEIADICL